MLPVMCSGRGGDCVWCACFFLCRMKRLTKQGRAQQQAPARFLAGWGFATSHVWVWGGSARSREPACINMCCLKTCLPERNMESTHVTDGSNRWHPPHSCFVQEQPSKGVSRTIISGRQWIKDKTHTPVGRNSNVAGRTHHATLAQALKNGVACVNLQSWGKSNVRPFQTWILCWVVRGGGQQAGTLIKKQTHGAGNSGCQAGILGYMCARGGNTHETQHETHTADLQSRTSGSPQDHRRHQRPQIVASPPKTA